MKVDRMELINSLAGVVGPSHPVDLEEPEKVILVEGIRVRRTYLGMLFNYRFNLLFLPIHSQLLVYPL